MKAIIFILFMLFAGHCIAGTGGANDGLLMAIMMITILIALPTLLFLIHWIKKRISDYLNREHLPPESGDPLNHIL